MADTNTLLAALLSSDDELRKANPYEGFRGISDELGGAVIKSSPNYDLKDSLIAGLITGAMSGTSGLLADNYHDKQTAAATNLLFEKLLNPTHVLERPSNIPPSVFSKITDTGNMFALENKLASNQAAQAAALKRQDTIFNEALKDPDKTEYNLQRLAEKAGAAEARPMAVQPGSYEDYRRQYGFNDSLAEKAMERDIKAPERTQDIRKEFAALPEVKTFILSDTGFRSMQEAFRDPAGTSDVELTRAAIQAIEPGLAVRMDDQMAIEQAPSIPAAWKAQLQGALTGSTRLDKDVREGLMRIAARRYNEHAENFNKARGFYTKQLEAAKLDPNSLTYMGEATPSDLTSLGLGEAVQRAGGLTPEYLKNLARTFPHTPEGQAAFRATVEKLRSNGR